MPVQTLLILALLSLVTACGVTDLARRRIPNRFLLLGWCVALPLQVAAGLPAGPLAALGGAATGLLLFLPLYMLRGMAAGDVKLMATVGAFVGPASALHIGLLAWAVGGAMALLVVIVRGQLRPVLANLRELLRPLLLRAAGVPLAPVPLSRPSVGSIPYGLAIAAAVIGFVWTRHG
ncbi:MAG TPA: A24 family peptidase [Telluria sp.]|nr:A24 family peptidase [Telluria sp.]